LIAFDELENMYNWNIFIFLSSNLLSINKFHIYFQFHILYFLFNFLVKKL
jgi:hypothetical protein